MGTKRIVDRVGFFLVPSTEEKKLKELARSAKNAMYEPGEGWRGMARKLFEALDDAAVARRIIEGEHVLAASAAFEEQVARHAGRRWSELLPRERRQTVAELLAKKQPAARKRSDDVPPKALAEHVEAVSQLLGEKAPATAGLWIEADLADPEPPDNRIEDKPSNVSAEESLRLLREHQEQVRANDRRRCPDAETDLTVRLCHTTAKAAAEAHGLLTHARGNDNRFAKARKAADALLVERAIACDESCRVGHIDAIRALDEVLAEWVPDVHDATGIYAPPDARALLETASKLRPKLIAAIDARVLGDAAEPFAWLLDSLRRAVAKRRAFAIVFDDTLL